MNIQFHLTKIANVYHVINAISNWDPHCRPNIQSWYRAMFGLSRQDEDILALYAQARRKCLEAGLSESLIPAAFLLSEDQEAALLKLSNSLPASSVSDIRVCFEHFMDNAGLLYDRCLPDLLRRKTELELRRSENRLEEMLCEMRSFLGAPSQLPDLNVHLLLNTSSGCTGGYAPVGYPGHVAVEPKFLGKSHPDYIASDFSIAAHEVSHLIFATNPCLKTSIEAELEKVGQDKSKADFVEEALIVTQFPVGYLAVKYGLVEAPKLLQWQDRPLPSQQEEPNLFIYTLQNKLGAEIYPLACEYCKQAKAISEGEFIAQAVKKFVEILGQI